MFWFARRRPDEKNGILGLAIDLPQSTHTTYAVFVPVIHHPPLRGADASCRLAEGQSFWTFTVGDEDRTENLQPPDLDRSEKDR